LAGSQEVRGSTPLTSTFSFLFLYFTFVNTYIKNLISLGENQHLDFKFEISDAKKIARTFSAFANSEGGKLLVGVKDNGVITGIRTDEEIFMLESAADLFSRPKVEYCVKTWQIEGKVILEVDIKESPHKPHLAPWKDDLWRAFIRVNDQNFLANSIQVAVWKKLLSGKEIIIKYNQVEKDLLGYLKQNKEISMVEFCRLAKIKTPIAKKVLINLVTIGVISINTYEKYSTFTLSKS
jgi:predicted HTH transcriptional regulator